LAAAAILISFAMFGFFAIRAGMYELHVALDAMNRDVSSFFATVELLWEVLFNRTLPVGELISFVRTVNQSFA